MNRILSAWTVASGAALLASGAFAQMNTPPRPQTTVTGIPFETVIGVQPDTNQIVVENAAGERRTIRLNDATMIERQGAIGGGPPRIGDIAAGDRVIVSDPAERGGFTPRIELLGPADVGAGPPAARPPAANPAAPPSGVTTPGVSNPASPPGATRPAAPTPAAPRPGAPRPAAPANPAAPPAGGAGAPR